MDMTLPGCIVCLSNGVEKDPQLAMHSLEQMPLARRWDASMDLLIGVQCEKQHEN